MPALAEMLCKTNTGMLLELSFPELLDLLGDSEELATMVDSAMDELSVGDGTSPEVGFNFVGRV